LQQPKVRLPQEMDVAAYVALRLGVEDFWDRDLAAHSASLGVLINAALNRYRTGGLLYLLREMGRYVRRKMAFLTHDNMKHGRQK
jgi:hypothetical protein